MLSSKTAILDPTITIATPRLTPIRIHTTLTNTPIHINQVMGTAMLIMEMAIITIAITMEEEASVPTQLYFNRTLFVLIENRLK